MTLRDIAVPVPNGNLRRPAKIVQPRELVVNERLEWTDVDTADGCRRLLGKQRDDGKERRLGLAGCRGRREQNVLVRLKDRLRRGNLHRAQILPTVRVDVVLDERRVAVERTHSSNSAKDASVSAPITSFCA